MIASRPEVEWDDVEHDWMLALQHWRNATICQLCGNPKSVCRAMETDGQVVVEAERCHITAAIARKQKANAEAGMELPQSLAYTATVKPTPA